MQTQPQPQHRWLERFLGEWSIETQTVAMPEHPAATFRGKETVRSLGGLWVIAEGQGEMPGGGMGNTIMSLGFDPMTGRFVGTFVGSMMPQLWVYDGSLEAGDNRLVLDTEGPDFEQKGLAKYQDIIEFESDDHRIMRSQVQTADGAWSQFMTAHYRRQS